MVREIKKSIWGIDMTVYEIDTDGGAVRLFLCYDAELVSDSLLRHLLLTEMGRGIYCVLALSFSPLPRVKLLCPHYSSPITLFCS